MSFAEEAGMLANSRLCNCGRGLFETIQYTNVTKQSGRFASYKGTKGFLKTYLRLPAPTCSLAAAGAKHVF